MTEIKGYQEPGVGDLTGKKQREPFGVMEIFHIFIQYMRACICQNLYN